MTSFASPCIARAPINRSRHAPVSRPAAAMALAGRARVQRKPGCACGGGCPTCKDGPPHVAAHRIEIGAPDDAFEREADQVAAQVMRMPAPDVVHEQIQADEPSVQPKAVDPHGGSPVGPVPLTIGTLGEAGQPLPAAVRAFFEPRFGHSFEGVRVHTGPAAEAAAADVGARAFAYGSSLVFGRGEFRPDAEAGRVLLAHELTHVIQQTGRRERIQRQVQVDPFAASTAPTVGLNPDMTSAFLAGLGPGGLRVNAGVTRFSVNGSPYASADTIAGNLALPSLSERDLRNIPRPNLRDPVLARVWSNDTLVRKGQKSAAVTLVQQALQAWGRGMEVPIDPLSVFGADADFRDETLAAVRQFQGTWAGSGSPLAIDGLVGPLTLAALEAAMQELNVSEYWLNAAPHNLVTGTIHHILPPAQWSTIPMMRSTLEARILAAGFHNRAFTACARRNNRLDFTAIGPANLDQRVLTHEQIHETDIGAAVRLHILPWHQAVAGLVITGQRFRAPSRAAAEGLIYAAIGAGTAPVGGDPCSVGGALEVELVDREFALHRRPNSGPRFTGFTTNTPQCTRAQANIDHQGGGRPRQVPALGCNPSPPMAITVQVPV